MVLKLLKETIRNFIKKPITVEYPKVKSPMITSHFRGAHVVDLNKCIGCSLCAIDCPSNAITMNKLPENVKFKQNRRGIYPVIDYGKCVFCYQCVFVCPVKAYVTSTEYRRVITFSRSDHIEDAVKKYLESKSESKT